MSWKNILICDECWDERCEEAGVVRTPVRVINQEPEPCGFCGDETVSGIYVREQTEKAPFYCERD